MNQIIATVEIEIDKIKGSRFIGSLFPIQEGANIAETIPSAIQIAHNEVRERYPNASHYCWAYRGMDASTVRYSDDGEPTGSAGRPILTILEGSRLCKVLCIVTRYFGGTKLGKGGLARAYTDAARQVLHKAKESELIQPIIPKRQLWLRIPYRFDAKVKHSIAMLGVELLSVQYEATVLLHIQVVETATNEVISVLTEQTHGMAHFME